MNLEQFLDRVIAPGPWLAIAYKDPTANWHGLAHKFFPRAETSKAAGSLRWCVRQRWDTWYAPASFHHAEVNARGNKNVGKRNRDNAEQIKSFWADADIKAPHDNKDPAKVFISEAEVVMWATAFTKATGIPRPNIWVKSGYGLHLYWSFEDALDVPTWRAHAEALKAALIANNFKGDVNVVADAVRILRPPETKNFKVPAQPVDVYEFVPAKLTQPDYPNSLLLPLIDKLPGYAPASKTFGTTGSGSSSSLNAARAGLSSRPRDFTAMAANCEQVAQSLALGGLGDSRDFWWHLINLASFCEDGRDWAHKLGENDPRYIPADTDAQYDLALADRKLQKGAPLCTTLDPLSKRPGVCQQCPHWTNPAIKSPFSVGLQTLNPSDPDELPMKWRRDGGWIEHDESDEKKINWVRVIEGNVTEPILDRIDAKLRLTFTYVPPNNPPHTLCVDTVELDQRSAKSILSGRGMFVSDARAPATNRLLMSWIEKLQRECRVRSQPMPSFGWYKDESTYLGFASGGVCYTTGGGEEQAPGADPLLLRRYAPQGTLAAWRQAAEFIGGTSPELHVMIAVAFGAPLMELQGGAGAVLSFVGASGVGKTAATRAGQAVWAEPYTSVLSVDDTSTYKALAIGQVRQLPIYWDEAKADDEINKLIKEIHTFTQGRDKGRGTADVKMRTPGEWLTIYSISTNDSIRDLITSHHGDTEATLLRLLEIRVANKRTYDVRADMIESSLKTNRGEAGRIYARYIADHTTEIKAKLANKKQKLDVLLKPSNDERFYVTTIAAIITGAELARDLGIIDLDLRGIVNVLVDAVKKSRHMRREETPVDPRERLGSYLDAYVTAYQQECVVTEYMKRPGPGAKPRIVYQPPYAPKDGLGIAYHISVADKQLRINQLVWRRFWNQRVISPSELHQRASERWGVPHAPERGLGFGTPFQTRAYAFTLSLGNDDLDYMLEPYQTTAPARVARGNVIPLPTKP